jgi:hypothetical protein
MFPFQYAGNWYETEGVDSLISPSGTTCVVATYGLFGKIKWPATGVHVRFGLQITGYYRPHTYLNMMLTEK